MLNKFNILPNGFVFKLTFVQVLRQRSCSANHLKSILAGILWFVIGIAHFEKSCVPKNDFQYVFILSRCNLINREFAEQDHCFIYDFWQRCILLVG